MAQLNPTSGKFNKFAINGAGVSNNALVFGNDQTPVDSTYGFDSSTDQAGVSVFFSSRDIAPGKSTKLEIWLWNGVTWSLWATIDGNDNKFSNLINTNINIAWAVGGTTYSKMYFNVKNIDGGMKIRVTGQESTIIIDNDTSDGIYDQSYLIGEAAATTVDEAEMSAMVSTRQSVTGTLEKEIKDDDTDSKHSEIELLILTAKAEKSKSELKDTSEVNINSFIDDMSTEKSIREATIDGLPSSYDNSIESHIASADTSIKEVYYTSVVNSLESEISEQVSLIDGADTVSIVTSLENHRVAMSTSISTIKGDNDLVDTYGELISYANEIDLETITTLNDGIASISTAKDSIETRILSLSVEIANS